MRLRIVALSLFAIAAIAAIVLWRDPFLLVRAASMLMEQGMRNTAGVKDHMDPIIDDLRQIYFDLTAEEAAGPAGAWRMRI